MNSPPPAFLCGLWVFLAASAVKSSKAFNRKERKGNAKIAEKKNRSEKIAEKPFCQNRRQCKLAASSQKLEAFHLHFLTISCKITAFFPVGGLVRLISDLICTLAAVCLLALASLAQSPAAVGPNSDPVYQQLRNDGLGSESVTVKDFELKRDGVRFHFHTGSFCFVAPVQGKVTGAVFVGDGNMVLDPPIPSEVAALKLLTKGDEFVEQYDHLVLRFTDSTYDDIKKAGDQGGSCDVGPLRASQEAMRHDRHLRYNLDARILQDVLGTEPGGLFVAFVPGKNYSAKEIYVIDPHGAPALLRFIVPSFQPGFPATDYTQGVAPEEVELLTYDENKMGIWAAFHLSSEYKDGSATGDQQNQVIQITHQALDTTIEKNAHLNGKASTTFVSLVDGLRVIPFNLHRTLKVQSAADDKGQPLSFIQEDKDSDADYYVVLATPLSLGQKFTVATTYDGKDVVVNQGSGNYYPIAREDWYPSQANAGFGNFATYDMTFRIPKGMQMAATGILVNESNDGGQNVTVWKSSAPQTVAGFNLGTFKVEQAKLTNPDYLVQAYANVEPPDDVKAFLDRMKGDLPGQNTVNYSEHYLVDFGNMSTVPLLKKAVEEAQASIQIYSDYFGPASYKQLDVTQQWACNYGQSWPGLLYLPICYFYDSTIRRQLGMEFHDYGYWKVVGPHEVAHQWWGHTVGFDSYRDQWMSEGFADFSASLYLQLAEKNNKRFMDFWNDERTLLTERNNMGFRAIDAGPLTMGDRLDNQTTGFDVTRRLIYPKGAYILHMVRMMMYSNQSGDQNFKDTMHDFTSTYAGHAATTEDFKATVEKHMTVDMQRIGNGKMDWFFDEYVYGTALPTYKLDSTFDKNADGDVVFNFKITQSGVTDKFRMLVPVYLELANGNVVFLGRVTLIGNNSTEAKVPLKGIKDTPHRAMLNYYDDVLASVN
jgi:Peptidase family M1 domain